MVVSHIVDTSVITRLAHPAVATRIQGLLTLRQVACTPMTMLEIGFSARSVAEFDESARALNMFECVDVTNDDFTFARHVQRTLAANGQRGRKIPDLLIAAVAHRLSLTVLHYDRDFALISDVTGQSHEWVVAAGTID